MVQFERMDKDASMTTPETPVSQAALDRKRQLALVFHRAYLQIGDKRLQRHAQKLVFEIVESKSRWGLR